MRIRTLVIGSICLLSLMTASSTVAQDLQSFYFAPEVGFALSTDGDVDDALFLGAKLGYNLNEDWAVELESGWMEQGVDVTENAQSLDIAVVPIMANIRYNHSCSWGKFYLFGGVGAAINDLEEDRGTDLEVDDSTIWQVGLGAETELTDGIDGFADIRYLYNEPDIDETGPLSDALLPSDVNLQVVLFNLGVKF